MPSLTNWLAHAKDAWNVFLGKETIRPNLNQTYSTFRPGRSGKLTRNNSRSIVNAIYCQIANDVAAIQIEHVKVDENGRYLKTIDSGLNNCLTLSANIDQTGRAFIFDAVMSMFDEGVVALVPTTATANPWMTDSYDIGSMRVGKITEWYPKAVKVQLYNENAGNKEDVILLKKSVAIVENPFYTIMNEPNSVLQRLVRKINLLDSIDEQSGSGKLDLIIQLPYITKSPARQEQAEKRRKDIEQQLEGSKFGIAYIDGTEKVTQLNRPLENNLMSQVEYLTSMLYSQLGMTDEILKGTANEATMLNYHNRTIEPILSAFADEMKRKFLTQTARTQHQTIKFFRDPFKLVQINNIADIADKFTRNEILSSNEVRGIIGFKPVDTERANELVNKNINMSSAEQAQVAGGYPYYDEYEEYPEEEYEEAPVEGASAEQPQTEEKQPE